MVLGFGVCGLKGLGSSFGVEGLESLQRPPTALRV